MHKWNRHKYILTVHTPIDLYADAKVTIRVLPPKHVSLFYKLTS